ncbi:DNA primase [Roseimaritima sediminicola]|uniref:DNA primase n=1 Tax=Roseimaritima sediminicola TaxID=2662066 RepID=UPI001EED8357|nr:DNA primase [Roseimaritima sediminicola]
MSLPGDFDVKEQVRAAVDIVDVIGQSLELRPKGRKFVALCPFHADKRPSFEVNPERQTWKCWPCDKGGDVFSFVQQRDGVSFPEAVRILAERAGIEMPERGGKRTEPGSPDDRATLFAAMKFAADAFYEFLESGRGEEAETARRYLAERQIDDESRQRFRIGYAPNDFKWLLNKAAAAGFKPEVIEAAGLARRKEPQRPPYDFFRGRIMFPIFDLQGRPISAGGRLLPAIADQYAGAKYFNGPDTLLYSKSHQLYGLNLAREAVVKSRQVMVMEGYTDVVAARQHGIEPVVAVLGTALGEGHLRLIKRFAERVILVLDGDQAGRTRADEVLELFIRADLDLRVLTLPDGMDPADYLNAHGRESFETLAGEAPDAIEHKLAGLLDGVDLHTDTHRAASAIETMLSIIAKAPQGAGDLRIDQILLRLSRVFGTAKDSLAARLKQIRIEQSRRRPKRSRPPATASIPGGSAARGAVRRGPGGGGPAGSPARTGSQGGPNRGGPNRGGPNRGGPNRGGPSPGGDPNAAFAESAEAYDDFGLPPSAGAASGAVDVPAAPAGPRWAPIEGIDRELFEILIEQPDLAPMAIETFDIDSLETDSARKILEAYQELDLAGRALDVQSLLLTVEEDALRNMIVTMDERVQRRAGQLTASPEQRYRDVHDRFQQRQWNVQRQRHLATLDAAGVSDDEATELLRNLFEGEKERKGLLNRPPAESSDPPPSMLDAGDQAPTSSESA